MKQEVKKRGLNVFLYVSPLGYKKPFYAFHARNVPREVPKRRLSIAYPYDGEYYGRNIGRIGWCNINETTTLIGSRY